MIKLISSCLITNASALDNSARDLVILRNGDFLMQCCNRTHCNLQTLLCVEKAMLVAISIDFHGQNYCFMWNFNT